MARVGGAWRSCVCESLQVTHGIYMVTPDDESRGHQISTILTPNLPKPHRARRGLRTRPQDPPHLLHMLRRNP